MFPLQYGDELLLEEAPILVQDSTLAHTNYFVENPKVTPKISKKRERISKSDLQENQNEESNEEKDRKIMHRDIERQRRQEMTRLYTALRNLLPAEYVKECQFLSTWTLELNSPILARRQKLKMGLELKQIIASGPNLEYIQLVGKRAVSDHMQEAVNYIKHMERIIKELQTRRDKLKNLSLSLSSSENGSSISVNLPNCVTVNSCWQGVEILIDCGIREGNYGFPLSRVIMELMLHTELNIVSCISTRVNERILYRILSEVNSLAYINLDELQQRLANVIN